MSNVVADYTEFKSHPVFKPDQVLSDTHLNQMMEYLDNEDRDTRTALIGPGITRGLEWKVETGLPDENGGNSRTTITIYDGVGVTSVGHLIMTEFNSPGKYSFALPYSLDKDQPQIPGLPADTIIYALIPDDMPGADSLEGRKPVSEILGSKETGLALMQEVREIDVQSCFVTSCDERGANRKFALKALLIQLSGDAPAVQNPVHVPVTGLPRVDIKTSNAPHLHQAYLTACQGSLISDLKSAITDINDNLLTQLSGLIDTTDVSPSGVDLNTARDLLFSAQPTAMQYCYDFITDIAQAVEEINALREELDHLFEDPLSDFPNHLVLGALNPGGTYFKRHDFQPAAIDRADSKQLEILKSLINRLNSLLETFSVPNPNNIIRITPSLSRQALLGLQSLPYYYQAKGDLAPGTHWNYKSWKYQRTYEILCYHNADSALVKDDVFKKPLSFYHDDKDYLYVEGIIGMQKTEALKALSTQRKDHHLPIDIVALRVSDEEHDEPYPEQPKDDPELIKEENFKDFLIDHPGTYHGHSVPKGGTLIVVFLADKDKTEGPVVATLMLPYICCCDQVIEATPDPEPFVLEAVGDERKAEANSHIDITVLDNDEFDRNNEIELDFVYDLQANDNDAEAVTNKLVDIQALDNDQYDKTEALEVDLLEELQAKDDEASVSAGKTLDIDVLKNDQTGSGSVELDFDSEN